MPYADHNATTPLDPEVEREVSRIARTRFGNPSSSYAQGREAAVVLADARRAVAEALGARFVDEVVFTASATESNCTALRLAAGNTVPAHRIVTTETEHASVIATCEHLKAFQDVDVAFVPVDGDGQLTFEAFRDVAMRHPPGVVSLILANNETGVVQDEAVVAAIGAWCRHHDVLLHLDATQAVGKIPVDVVRLGADLLSLSAHKFYGPRGVGALWVRREARHRVLPLMTGGKQEMDLRAGTENVPGIHGLAVAIRRATEEDALGAYDRHVRALRDRARDQLLRLVPGALVIGGGAARVLPNTLSVSLPGVDSRRFVRSLDEAGISVGIGSACSKGKRSRVLQAYGVPEERERGVFRISFGKDNTVAEVDAIVAVFHRTWLRLGVSPVPEPPTLKKSQV